MNNKKVLISTSTFGEYNREPLEMLDRSGLSVVINPFKRKLKEAEVKDLIKDVGLLIAGTETLSRGVLESAKMLKVISRCGGGVDSVDLVTAKELGIKVFNTPDAPVVAVAELTIGLILNLLRNVSLMSADMRNGKWEKLMGNLLCEKKVGIKGFGRIGKKVAELLRPFGCEIAYSDPFVEDGLFGLRRLSLEELLAWADIVTVHVSVSETLMGKREFPLMKKGAWLINASRGGVVDESILYECLESGHLSGAAIDVFNEEPYVGPLKDLENVILTPHIGSYAMEARVVMEKQAVENLLKGLGDFNHESTKALREDS
jgi:D-3-phosphoglycerate dehydrogenase